MTTSKLRSALQRMAPPSVASFALALLLVACVDDRSLVSPADAAASEAAASDGRAPDGESVTIDASVGEATTGGGDATVFVSDGSARVVVDGAPVAPDDEAPKPCATGAKRKCADDPDTHALGNCADGVETCTAGIWGACSVVPAANDACTMGDDANCNGTKNDGCPCIDGARQSCGPALELGDCRRGTQTCAATKWGECVGAVVAKPRDCTSGLDLDCDGVPDNKLDASCKCALAATQECDAHPGKDGKGPCHPGTQSCVVAADKKSSAFGACSGAVGPAATDTCETDNDNNCNGVPNDGCSCVNGATQPCGPTAVVGICKRGTQSCASSTWGACVGAVFASGRDCSKTTDNDCNGTPDQSESSCECAAGATRDCTTTRLGPCRPGTQTCALASDKKSTSWGACSGLAPASKDGCNPGEDNNCNGIANEGCTCVNGATKACGDDTGICQKGTQTCVSTAWGACEGQVTPRSRDCTSASDNDCNGTADNKEAPCTACVVGTTSCATGAKGTCATGKQTCSLAADKSKVSLGSCVAPSAATKDGCSPKDDANCDGTVGGCCDAGSVCPGSNPCRKYTMTCNSSLQLSCTDSGQNADDGTGCGSGGHCSAGVCCGSGQSACGGTCKDTYTDVNNCGACGKKCSPAGSGMTVQCRDRQCVSLWGFNSAQCGGSASGWLGCQGTGCGVCADQLGGYPLYSKNHPSCVNNSTCELGTHYACSAECPLPTAADACEGSPGGWDGCRGSGCAVCSELVAGYAKYFQHHVYCRPNETCDRSYGGCNSNCPLPTADDR